jgi:hypothetical protein
MKIKFNDKNGSPRLQGASFIGVLKVAGGRHKNTLPLGYYGASDYGNKISVRYPLPHLDSLRTIRDGSGDYR